MSTLSLNPRRGLPWVQSAIFFSLTAMEMAWFAPLVMIFLPETWRTSPVIYLLGLWMVMMGLMVIAHFLEQRDIPSPAFELIVAGLLFCLGVLAVRIFVFGDASLTSFAWMRQLVSPGDEGVRIGVILGALAFLWWRAVIFLQREITFFVVGYDFRKGVLALLVTVSIFRNLSGQSALFFVFVFFFFGLAAVALGRAEEKARVTGEGRAPIQRAWLGVVGLSVSAVMGVAWLFGRLWSLEGFRALWRGLTPVVGWMSPYAEAVILFFLRLLNPLLEWLVDLLAGLVGGQEGEQVLQNLTKNMPGADKLMSEGQDVYAPPNWMAIFFRYIIPVIVVLVVLFLLAFWLVRRRKARKVSMLLEEYSRVESMERAGLMDALRRGLDKVKGVAGMVGRFGVGKGFYAAISIRHVYANLQRLAAHRGFPRDSAWTPNDYLPSLMRAFPGQEAALRHITDVYNAFEYGHVSTESEEMARLREAWAAIQASAAPETTVRSQHDFATE